MIATAKHRKIQYAMVLIDLESLLVKFNFKSINWNESRGWNRIDYVDRVVPNKRIKKGKGVII